MIKPHFHFFRKLSPADGQSSISHKVLFYILLFSSFVTLLVTALQLYSYYREQAGMVEQRMTQIEQSYGDSLARAMWQFDARQIQNILTGIMKFEDVHYAGVQIKNGETYTLGQQRLDENLRRHEVDMLYKIQDRTIPVGQLSIESNLEDVVQRLGQKFWLILISQAVKTFFVSFFILFIIYYLVTRHLKNLARYTSALSFDKQALASPLVLDRQVSNPASVDELGQVVNAINDMQVQLAGAMSKIQESEQRFKALFENAEVSIWNEDFSEVIKRLDRLREDGVSDLGQYLRENEQAVWDLAAMVRINHVNETTLRMYKAKSEQEFIKSIDKVFGADSLEVFSSELCAFWEKRETFRSDATQRTLEGEEMNVIISMPIPNAEEGFRNIPVSILDITERKLAQEKLSYQASHDALTGLINRFEFEKRTQRLLATIMHDKSEHAMCFLDLDQFKVINDTCGHVAGDELLRQLGRLLQNTVRDRDTLARLGGDEFGVLMEHCPLEQANRVAGAMLKAIQEYQFFWEGEVYRIGASLGLVAIIEATGSFTELFKQADVACYLAKDLGRNRIYAYHPEDTELAIRHGEMQWVGRINQALDDNHLCLYAQPIVAMGGGNLKHYELLVRMLDEQGEIIPPGAFLPAAERYNLIERLDTWVFNHACTFLAEPPAFVEQIDFVSINLSGPSLTNRGFLETIMQNFTNFGVLPGKICFEVTETVAVSNLASAASFISTLKRVGCRFALDDFGSGISSFGYLKNLPVDYLKIDGIFVKDIVDDPIDRAMVKSINEIGQVMGMQTIAEFVENDEIKGMLKAIGVNFAQGYGVGKPMPLEMLIGDPNSCA